jgi:hypothetical protein
MSAETSVRVGLEMDVETVEMEDGLVEMGPVSKVTKGSFIGTAIDTSGNSWRNPS